MTFTYSIPTNPLTNEPIADVVLRSDGWFIPTDPANSDYQAYLATLATNSAPTAQ